MASTDLFAPIPWSLNKASSGQRYLLAALTVLMIGGPLYVAGDLVSDDNEMLFYLGSGMVGALYYGRGPARLASLLCLFVLHVAHIHPGFRVVTQGFQYFISFTFFMLATDQIARFADQARREAWQARRREKAEEILRHFAEQCTILETAPQLDELLKKSSELYHQPDSLARQVVKTMEEQCALAKERLQHRERLRQDELLRATQKLQTTLINSISHDLQTPLSTIAGTVDTLRLSVDKLSRADRQELLQLASEQIMRLEKLVKNILNLSKMEAGGLSFTRAWVNIGELLSVVKGRFPKQAAARIQLLLPDDFPEVKGDFTLLSQVFANLIDNALKFSQGAVQIDGCQRAGTVCVSVKDTGVGVQPDEVELIFEKFFRGTTPMAVPGSGLGLNICRGVVELHAGGLRYDPEPAGGSRFTVTLPLEVALVAH
ncbi:MAG: DUF4118 domain-containing protein [Candidatus Eremiobacteraeota bacterium]|nr:DUF4118 domain-containing protein [Candidatus Eremiobacteraeota bacterium]MCW5867932.1 DUF4118 domain-containing protein [Candidatus Eremiobacteraeota bacterium]